jgi:nucleotide-binding universal stress UspA family protein
MSNADTESAIVVWIAPAGRVSDGTIAFVVETAASLQMGVQLVHVVPTVVGGPTGVWDVGVAFDRPRCPGPGRLDNALARFRGRAARGVPMEAALVRGGVVANLVERSRTAELVVLEHRHLTGWERFASGSITAGVAAQANAPVVSVPAGWQPRHRGRPVTVGVEDAKRAASEIWTALGLAAAGDLPIRLLRVAHLPRAYQEVLRREVEVEDILVVAREELERDAQLPGVVAERVPCTFEVRWGRPAEVLVESSKDSSLLVLARRDPIMPFGSHLGPVVRKVLRDAECPVMVVEPALSERVVVAVAPATYAEPAVG